MEKEIKQSLGTWEHGIEWIKSSRRNEKHWMGGGKHEVVPIHQPVNCYNLEDERDLLQIGYQVRPRPTTPILIGPLASNPKKNQKKRPQQQRSQQSRLPRVKTTFIVHSSTLVYLLIYYFSFLLRTIGSCKNRNNRNGCPIATGLSSSGQLVVTTSHFQCRLQSIIANCIGLIRPLLTKG